MQPINVEVVRSDTHRCVDIRFSVPYEAYAGSLYPNETLREAIMAAFDEHLDKHHGRR